MSTTVLLLDDSADFTKLVGLRLRSFIPDLVLITCSTIAAARQRLTATPAVVPDLVILDHHLPDGIGLELMREERLQGLAVLAVSSDPHPELPGDSMRAGVTYFLPKDRVRDASFRPLVLGLIDRNRVQREVQELRRSAVVVETVRTLVGTLRHEINNPLGAVMGGAFILKSGAVSEQERAHAAKLVEESARRIKHVLDQLSTAVALEQVVKAEHTVFQVPGDTDWGRKPQKE